VVKVKVKYSVQKEKELELTTREWCEIHADKMGLVKQLAEENNVSVIDIVVQDGYCDIIQGEFDFKKLDK
jgi:hypothetical protein